MYARKNLGLRGVLLFSGHHLPWLTAWAAIVTLGYEITGLTYLSIPWLPLSVIGTAVAFYLGFKNNQSYDRLWEARKIWGAIVNTSRAWGSNVKAYVSNVFTDKEYTKEELHTLKLKLVKVHIAWLYMLRRQLLQPTDWEHINQSWMIARFTRRRMRKAGVGLVEDDLFYERVRSVFSEEEKKFFFDVKNRATHIVDYNSQLLAKLREDGLIDDFRHMELQKLLNDFYVQQGKAERIKKFPLPRQYGSMSTIFVGIFILLLPFGMVTEFAKMGEWSTWMSIPLTVLVAWVFLVMELIGDYSENPFEGLSNDIPMLSLCRTIEIDLLEMMGETDLPDPIKTKNGVLM